MAIEAAAARGSRGFLASEAGAAGEEEVGAGLEEVVAAERTIGTSREAGGRGVGAGTGTRQQTAEEAGGETGGREGAAAIIPTSETGEAAAEAAASGTTGEDGEGPGREVAVAPSAAVVLLAEGR